MKLKDLKKLIESASDDAEIKIENGEIIAVEPEKQPITERIKTFDDAVEWCKENGEANLVNHYDDWEIYNNTSKDVVAYLALRIITCALNEGWEPTEDDFRHTAYYQEHNGKVVASGIDDYYCDASIRLCFKSKELAEYAATQFADIYANYCRCEDKTINKKSI